MTIDDHDRLESIIAASIEVIAGAVSAMEQANRQLVQLLSIRSGRPWNAEEFGQYLDLCRRERTAHRRYAIGRDRFDNARRAQSNRGRDSRLYERDVDAPMARTESGMSSSIRAMVQKDE